MINITLCYDYPPFLPEVNKYENCLDCSYYKLSWAYNTGDILDNRLV